MGSLLDAARADAKRYVSEGGFEEAITLKTPSGDVSISTKGLASKHHISYGTDGAIVSGKNAHVCLSESDLVAQAYPYRVSGEVKLFNHRIDVKDSTGVLKSYVIREHYPDETLGLIVCILGDYSAV